LAALQIILLLLSHFCRIFSEITLILPGDKVQGIDTTFLEDSLYNNHLHFCLFLCFQLTNLERKWQHHEQNNFMMKECILFFKNYSKIHALH